MAWHGMAHDMFFVYVFFSMYLCIVCMSVCIQCVYVRFSIRSGMSYPPIDFICENEGKIPLMIVFLMSVYHANNMAI